MSTRSVNHGLSLDGRARIVVSGDTLRLLHRRGLVELRGKGLERLHERVAPLLDGRWTREEVRASAGPHADQVSRYLDALREGGVLCDGLQVPDLPAGLPTPRSGLQVLTMGGVRIAVTLSGDESHDAGALRLSFASRATIEQRLLELEDLRADAGRIWIVCDTEPRPEELVRRAAVARHLLAVAVGSGHQPRINIFQLAADRLSLQQLAVVTPTTSLEPLAAQLQLVRLSDCPQLPLVVMAGDLTGLGRRRVGCGFDAKEITAALIPAFIGREALLHRIDLGLIDGASGDIRQRGTARTHVRLTRAQGVRAAVAFSRSACAEEMIRAWALDLPSGAAGRTIDLLAVDAPSTRVAVLQDALRRRRATLRARLDDRLSPLLILRSRRFAVARLGLEEVLAEALLRGTSHAVGLNASAVLAFVPPLRPATRSLRALAVARQLAGSVRVITGRFRLLGTTLFFGVVDHGKEGSS